MQLADATLQVAADGGHSQPRNQVVLPIGRQPHQFTQTLMDHVFVKQRGRFDDHLKVALVEPANQPIAAELVQTEIDVAAEQNGTQGLSGSRSTGQSGELRGRPIDQASKRLALPPKSEKSQYPRSGRPSQESLQLVVESLVKGVDLRRIVGQRAVIGRQLKENIPTHYARPTFGRKRPAERL